MSKKPIELLVSDESVNSYNIRILTAGGDFSRFEKNSIMLFNHIRAISGKIDDILPIGTWIDFRVEGTQIFATPKFDLTDDFAVKISKKFTGGVIRSASIGIRVLEMAQDGVDQQGRKQYIVTKWQLMEISLVDIPSNENAVAFYNDQDEPIELSAVVTQFAAAKSKNELPMKYQNVPGLLGLSTDASDGDVANAINAMLLLKTENEGLRADLKVIRDANILSLVDQAITDKKINAESKDQYIKLLNADFDSTKAIIENLAIQVNLSDVPNKNNVNENVTTELKHEGMTFGELQRKDSAKLAKLKVENFQLFKDMYKNEYSVEYVS